MKLGCEADRDTVAFDYHGIGQSSKFGPQDESLESWWALIFHASPETYLPHTNLLYPHSCYCNTWHNNLIRLPWLMMNSISPTHSILACLEAHESMHARKTFLKKKKTTKKKKKPNELQLKCTWCVPVSTSWLWWSAWLGLCLNSNISSIMTSILLMSVAWVCVLSLLCLNTG